MNVMTQAMNMPEEQANGQPTSQQVMPEDDIFLQMWYLFYSFYLKRRPFICRYTCFIATAQYIDPKIF